MANARAQAQLFAPVVQALAEERHDRLFHAGMEGIAVLRRVIGAMVGLEAIGHEIGQPQVAGHLVAQGQ